ncbi:Dps family protein [Parvularcula dongshanensis]|uniref:Starvation-inducible DNA-binding protein n=1 Tax=Parvularcula dongshanensis TaxID=1173995 RepID=A0A840I0J4_9PROT|nr:DNA starvation/stationary phase protection protein [Parvularcula dongshanensis]MBB4658349.1 starvation-inducible DNA-binding protein [Parvularcula dongshanensis]
MKRFLLPALAPLVLALPAAAQDLSVYKNEEASSMLPLGEDVRDTSNKALQDTLYELIALKHDTHQAHWNVEGPLFYSLHDLLGETYQGLSPLIDTVAERKRALGAPADGRNGAVADGANLPVMEGGPIQDHQVLAFLTQEYGTVSQRVEARIEATSDDPTTQDILIDVTREIEKRLWMLRAFQQ